MAKTKTVYVCTECGTDSPKWMGKCPSCSAWNSFQEHKIEKKKSPRSIQEFPDAQPVRLLDVVPDQTKRVDLKDQEFNRVLGGGLVRGSLVLLGGEPGIGKSTLLLQIALAQSGNILYASGEESAEQIKMRADRMQVSSENCYILTETNIDKVLKVARDISPEIIIMDSIQTMRSSHLESAAGTVSQVRESTGILQQYAKTQGIPIIIIGHINKDGAIAGPKVLEHIVDVVLQFEGDQNHVYRLLRTSKNRFGSTDEIGVYEMSGIGLKEINNPSEILLDQQEQAHSGSVIAVNLEGRRPILIEVQALVSTAVYGTPQRTTNGYDLRRLQMMLAVLEKRAGFKYGMQDVFLNIAGGLKVSDPAVDLAIVSSLISSLDDFNVSPDICCAGEVGLSGEIRSINYIENRIQEADRLGFTKIIVPKHNMKGIKMDPHNIEIIPVSRVDELYDILTF